MIRDTSTGTRSISGSQLMYQLRKHDRLRAGDAIGPLFLTLLGAIAACGISPSPASSLPSAATPAGTTPAGGSPKSSPGADQHIVPVAGGTLEFRLDAGAIVVRLIASGNASELGRKVLAGVYLPAASSDASFAASYILSCPGSTAGVHRIVFGYIHPSAKLTYTGPPATGQSASDGLFLFALANDTSGSSSTILIDGGGPPAPSLQLSVSSFDMAKTVGQLQPSGCYILG